jgi:hypothetical protein
MSDAINNPVNRAKRETNTGDMKVGQRDDILISGTGPVHRQAETIVRLEDALHPEYADALAFDQEPVAIRLEPTGQENAPMQIQCHVNGRPAELLINGKWVPYGWIPVGKVVVTKRMYVEVLARAKPEAIKTDVHEIMGQDPMNMIRRTQSTRCPLSIIKDNNPRGAEWLTRIIAEAA